MFSRLLRPGGKVTFNVGNDSPTLTGAKVTFTIDLEFPHNQKVQPNGDVVWAEDCIVNGNTPCTTHTYNTVFWPSHGRDDNAHQPVQQLLDGLP